MKRAAALFLAAVALSSARAQVPVVNGMPLLGRVSAEVATFSEAEILSGFGRDSTPGRFAGSGVSKVLGKAGRYVKWGGGLMIGATVAYDALNWFYEEAKRSAGGPLDQWYDTKGGPFREVWTSPESVFYTRGATVRDMNHPDLCAFAYWGMQTPPGTNGVSRQGIFVGYKWSNGQTGGGWLDLQFYGGGVYPVSPDAAVRANNVRAWSGNNPITKCAKTGLVDFPGAAASLANVIRQYLDAHPNAVPPLLSPLPNANQIADDVVDVSIDTDGDGITDADELRRGPGVGPNPGNVPHPSDGPVTDPNEPSSRPLDTDGDGIPDWRDSDDDNDGFNDDQEEPGWQKDKTKTPDTELDTDGDGIPDRLDPDDDNDGWSDEEEEAAGTDKKNPTSKPLDTDGDGIPDHVDTDDDGDGWSDADEIKHGSDPKNPRSTPDKDGDGQPDPKDPTDPDPDPDPPGDPDPDPDPPGDPDPDPDPPGDPDPDPEPDPDPDPDPEPCPVTAQSAGAPGCDEEPEEPEEPCPDGFTRNSDGLCVEDKEEEDNTPVPNDCGNFSVKRLLAHTGGYLRDVVFPCEDVGDILAPIVGALRTKFPFSLASSLSGWFQPPSGGGGSSHLPSSLGIIPLDWGWVTPLWTIIKNIVGIALWAWFIYWIIDRFTPRAQI